MAIVFAVCTYLPQHKVYIFLLGPVKLVYLALFTALIDIMSISSGNAGGHIAHLGGALFGWFLYRGSEKKPGLCFRDREFFRRDRTALPAEEEDEGEV